MKIRDILQKKGNAIYTVAPELMLSQAIALLCEKRIGAVLVVDSQNKPAGILSERDILRQCNLRTNLDTTPVSAAMSSNLVIGLLDDSIERIMNVLTEKHIRHLPILSEGNKIEGMVSIGDVVSALRDEREDEILYLRDYMGGNYR